MATLLARLCVDEKQGLDGIFFFPDRNVFQVFLMLEDNILWEIYVTQSRDRQGEVEEGKLKAKHLDGEAAACWRYLASIGDARPSILSRTSI